MARPLLAQYLTPPSAKVSKEAAKRNERRERAARLAVELGPPGLTDQLNPLKKNPWLLEKEKRQSEVRSRYFSDKRRMRQQRLHTEERMKKSLLRRQTRVEGHYRLDEFKPADPRYDRAARLAKLRYGQYEREAQRKNRERWQKQARALKFGKTKQYRQITAAMKKEFRSQRGLPAQRQAPWDL